MIDFIRQLNAPCRDMTEYVSRSLDSELTRSQRAAVQVHMLYCRACRRYRAQVRMLRALLAERPDAPEILAEAANLHLDPATKDRIIALLRERSNPPKPDNGQ
ncbi:MAG TPA: zf-HC2 domain-containing protein [Phycisphaerae bacterium]|nr:zf-HC2 domain-containing protein [Phycisphaerales bacterium]HRX85456.1 zf-HC2 domain-containing protein [Phycisphaerae bacterium]